MSSRLRVGINGIGRIGKAVFRQILDSPRLKVVAINDVNPDKANIAYQLKYDSQYGIRDEEFGHINRRSSGGQ